MASLSIARHSPQISVPEFAPSELTTASFMLSQAAQPVVGSPDSGSTGVIALARSNSPVFSVTSWNEVRQSPQTWFQQHFGSQEYTTSALWQCGQRTMSFRVRPATLGLYLRHPLAPLTWANVLRNYPLSD